MNATEISIRIASLVLVSFGYDFLASWQRRKVTAKVVALAGVIGPRLFIEAQPGKLRQGFVARWRPTGAGWLFEDIAFTAGGDTSRNIYSDHTWDGLGVFEQFVTCDEAVFLRPQYGELRAGINEQVSWSQEELEAIRSGENAAPFVALEPGQLVPQVFDWGKTCQCVACTKARGWGMPVPH